MRVTAHKSCALAAQTFMIAMANEGYDTCPLEGLDMRFFEIAKRWSDTKIWNISVENFKEMNRRQYSIRRIYRRKYASTLKCGQLPAITGKKAGSALDRKGWNLSCGAKS